MEESMATISFVVPLEVKARLERWAKEDDRTVSAVLRQILKREETRRKAQPTQNDIIPLWTCPHCGSLQEGKAVHCDNCDRFFREAQDE